MVAVRTTAFQVSAMVLDECSAAFRPLAAANALLRVSPEIHGYGNVPHAITIEGDHEALPARPKKQTVLPTTTIF